VIQPVAGQLPDKAATEALRALFTAAGINPDVPQVVQAQFTIGNCPLGTVDQLTASPPVPVAGLDGSPVYTLVIPRQPVPSVRCSFTDAAGGFLEYQATYVPSAQLRLFTDQLDSQGYEQLGGGTLGGVMFKECGATETSPSTTVAGSGDCSVIWLNGVIVVGVRYSGAGAAGADVPTWLGKMIEPMITALSTATATSVGVPPPATTP